MQNYDRRKHVTQDEFKKYIFSDSIRVFEDKPDEKIITYEVIVFDKTDKNRTHKLYIKTIGREAEKNDLIIIKKDGIYSFTTQYELLPVAKVKNGNAEVVARQHKKYKFSEKDRLYAYDFQDYAVVLDMYIA